MLSRWSGWSPDAESVRESMGCLQRGPRTVFSGRPIAARLPACLPLCGNTTAWSAGASPSNTSARPVRPQDFDGVHRVGRPWSEVGAGVVAAQVALAGVDPADPAAVADPAP